MAGLRGKPARRSLTPSTLYFHGGPTGSWENLPTHTLFLSVDETGVAMKEPILRDKVIPLPSAPSRSMSFWGEQLLEALPAGVYVCDREGVVLRFNDCAVRLWGRAPKPGDTEQRFCGAYKLFWPDGTALPFDRTPMAEVLQTGLPVLDQEVVIERPDATRISVLVNIHPLFDEDGQLAGAVNCFQDITRRNRSEETVKEAERRSRELLDALPAAIYTTDAAGHLTFFNEAAVALWGYRPELGSSRWCGSWRLYHPDGTPMPHDQCPMAQALKERHPIRGEEAIAERPDGTRVSFLPYPTLLHDSSGALIGAVNMLVDITEHKAAEERLKLLAREVDHRAKNMLSVIQAVVHLTRADSIADFKAAIDGRLAALARAHTLLSNSRWDGADLRQIVEEELAPYLGGENVRVSLDGPTLPLAPALAQSVAMALHELATNAVKHGAISQPEGHLELRWWGSVGDRLLLRWTETGCSQVQPPQQQGFGISIIHTVIVRQVDGAVDFEWRGDGLRCELDIPLPARE